MKRRKIHVEKVELGVLLNKLKKPCLLSSYKGVKVVPLKLGLISEISFLAAEF